MEVAKIIQRIAREERGIGVDVELVENPRSGETMVEQFGVDISATRETIGWEVRESVADAVRAELVLEE
jgi:UDP-glucose 4-epimerase